MQDVDIKTEGTEIHPNPNVGGTVSHGIYARNEDIGDIDVDLAGGSIETKGTLSYGIYGVAQHGGDMRIKTRDGHTVTTTGDQGHGIVAYTLGTTDSRTIDVTVGGDIDASGANADGVRVGTVNAMGDPERVAALDEEGYRRQTVTVNGSVFGGSGEGAGVDLAGGGRIHIGPSGTVGAASGVAIRASGGAPKLYVDMNLDGARWRTSSVTTGS